MSSLPQVSGDRLIRALIKMGFYVAHQKGSHCTLFHSTDKARSAVVPLHKGKALKPGTLRAILKGSGMSVEELKALL